MLYLWLPATHAHAALKKNCYSHTRLLWFCSLRTRRRSMIETAADVNWLAGHPKHKSLMAKTFNDFFDFESIQRMCKLFVYALMTNLFCHSIMLMDHKIGIMRAILLCRTRYFYRCRFVIINCAIRTWENIRTLMAASLRSASISPVFWPSPWPP